MHDYNSIRRDFDRIAEVSTSTWDHNMYFHSYLVRFIPRGGRVLDIGCGTGEFTRILAKSATEVVGIDLSPVMIEKALEKSKHDNNIDYQVQDIFDLSEDKQFDAVVSIAAMHHLLPDVLPKVYALLKPGGWLVVLDILAEENTLDYLMSLISVPGNVLARLVRTGSLNVQPEEKQAWNEHAQNDHFMTRSELYSVYQKGLGGQISLKRHLFWRYSMVWQKPKSNIEPVS